MDTRDAYVILAFGVAPAAYAVSTADLTYPYYTFSDVASAPGAPLMWLGMLVEFGWLVARRKSEAVCPLLLSMFPLVVLPTPIVLRQCMHARGAAHLAHATCTMLSLLTFADARAVAAMALLFAATYFGGQLVGATPLVLVGCGVEWAMLLAVPLYHCFWARPRPKGPPLKKRDSVEKKKHSKN
jgi:hypothetical protein